LNDPPANRTALAGTARIAKTLCRWLLRSKGYHILEKGYCTKVEEIDLLATRRGWLVAVEVKVRATHADALQAAT